MPNFRQVYVGSETLRNVAPIKLYRSSRPDFLTEQEHDEFLDVGIASIIDCRSVKEYWKSSGSKLVNESYNLFKVRSPIGKQKPDEKVKYSPLSKLVVANATRRKNGKCSEEKEPLISNGKVNMESDEKYDIESNYHLLQRNHFLIDFFKLNYVWAIYNRAPWYVKLYSLLILLFDVIFNTGYKHFVRVFARNVLNRKGLIGQYKDIINYSQGPICSALKLMLDPANVPAMVNCAHGKDRTGIVTAMVLVCFGETKERISLDYAQSEVELTPLKKRLHEEIVTKFHMCETFLTSRAETMMELLTSVENEYGSLPNYLEAIGFSKDHQAALRDTLSYR